ncbi:hydroxyacid dehydrogenase [Marinivivus vitaminiproducens]|uniref:hydroxyacid dehydrogenase n=1 Tax=Marinivivus vitaminiproducens TaxID=3035935 RepID=UPI0027A6B614|nr:hydroxyacid dehydrogenase [Geminicoccaceae bacterium SCSIO 64248]
MMAERPCLAFALHPGRTQHVFTPALRSRLDACCVVLDHEPLRRLDDDRAIGLLAQAEILITGWGCPRVDRSTLTRARKLKLIAHSAGSVRHFLDPHLFDLGITLSHAAAANAQPVAEYALAAILFANKRAFCFNRMYGETRARGPELVSLTNAPLGNYRSSVGLIGASRIGRRVIELLRPFDVDILLYDPFVSPDEARTLGVRLETLDALLESAQVVSLHAPSLASTHHMIDARRLALIRDGATLVNTARGALIDQAALEAELRTGRFQAVIDVTDPEIPDPDSPLYDMPNVFLTPHIAGALGTERERLGELTVTEVERWVEGQPLRHVVTPDRFDLIA